MKLKQYLHNQLAHTFFPIFFGLFFITSIIFLVKIASLTSVITINIFELFQLYLYVLPTIIFYTTPISFFIALVITLAKLSSEYELIVITSFGLNPVKIMKIFFPITLILSLSLMIISVGLIPKTKYLNERFLEHKKKEANFNIKASEFGQKFGDWLIYISEKEDKKYDGVKLFKTEKGSDQFVISKSAVLDNNEGELSFKLFEGKSFNISEEELNQIDFKQMTINDSIKDKNIEEFTTTYAYWEKWLSRGKDFDDLASYVLTSLFPLLSLVLIVSLGYFNPRYEKNKSTAIGLVYIVVYYGLAESLSESVLLHSLYIVPTLWLLGSYFIYKKTVQQQY